MKIVAECFALSVSFFSNNNNNDNGIIHNNDSNTIIARSNSRRVIIQNLQLQINVLAKKVGDYALKY